MKIISILVAGGIGSRMHSNEPKQFMKINDKEIMLFSFDTFYKCNKIDEIILVSHKDYISKCKELINFDNLKKPTKVISGGTSRQESVHNGIKEALKDNKEAIILVHDVARPFVNERIILDNIEAVKKYGAATTAIPVFDTVYIIEGDSVSNSLDRNKIFLAQTPQSGLLSLFAKAYKEVNETFTDEASLLKKAGIDVHIVAGDIKNKKITTIEDLDIRN